MSRRILLRKRSSPSPTINGTIFDDRVDALLVAGHLVAAWLHPDMTTADLMDPRTPGHTAQPLTYNWDGGDAVINSANPGGNGNGGSAGSITYTRDAAERLCLALSQSGVAVFPELVGSEIRIKIPSGADAGNGGYITFPYRGLGTSFYVGPDHANGGFVDIQYRWRVDSDFMTFRAEGSAVYGSAGLKQILHFSEPPNGEPVSGFGIVSNLDLDKGLFRMVHGGPGGDPFETVDGAYIVLQQGPPLCYYAGGPDPHGNNYAGYSADPDCYVVTGGEYECTDRLELRPVASNFVVSGTTLSRASTFESDCAGRPVYIVGDGFYIIASYTNAGAVELTTAPAAGSGKSVYISYHPNSRMRRWVNGLPVMDYPSERVSWGPFASSSDGDGNGRGFGQIKLQPHMTGKNEAAAHTPTAVFYRELIIGTSEIPRMTALDRLAATMGAEEFQLLTTTGMDAAFLSAGGSSGLISGYGMSPMYDSWRQQVHFLGGDHHPGSASIPFRHVRLNLPTAAWADLGEPAYFVRTGPTSSNEVHNYHHTAINVTGRRLYRIPLDISGGVDDIQAFDLDADSTTTGANWVSLPDHGKAITAVNAMEFFPEINSLIVAFEDGDILKFSETSQTWTNITPAGMSGGYLSTWFGLCHNPVLHEMLLYSDRLEVAGTTDLWKLAVGGTSTDWTHLTDFTTTHRLYDGSGFSGQVSCEPVTGLYLWLTDPTAGTGRNLYLYNSQTDSFSLAPTQLLNKNLSGQIVACPIRGTNVTLYLAAKTSGGNATSVQVYKHAVS